MANNTALYGPTGTLTIEGEKVDAEVLAFLVPIFTAGRDGGYDIRQLSHLIIHCVATTENIFVIERMKETTK